VYKDGNTKRKTEGKAKLKKIGFSFFLQFYCKKIGQFFSKWKDNRLEFWTNHQTSRK
jgi:hypothetical protein